MHLEAEAVSQLLKSAWNPPFGPSEIKAANVYKISGDFLSVLTFLV